MKPFTVTKRTTVINIGKQGEKNARPILFPVASWYNDYGSGGVFNLNHRRADDAQPYPVTIEVTDEGVLWSVMPVDNAQVGIGECELTYSVNNVIVKSATWQTQVIEALAPSGDTPPDPYESWYENVLEASNRAVNAADESEDSANASAESAASASDSATAAGISANDAQTALQGMVYVTFVVNSEGHITIQNGDLLGTTSFQLVPVGEANEGHLEVTY